MSGGDAGVAVYGEEDGTGLALIDAVLAARSGG